MELKSVAVDLLHNFVTSGPMYWLCGPSSNDQRPLCTPSEAGNSIKEMQDADSIPTSQIHYTRLLISIINTSILPHHPNNHPSTSTQHNAFLQDYCRCSCTLRRRRQRNAVRVLSSSIGYTLDQPQLWQCSLQGTIQGCIMQWSALPTYTTYVSRDLESTSKTNLSKCLSSLDRAMPTPAARKTRCVPIHISSMSRY